MRRWIRLAWIGSTNGLFLLPSAYFLRNFVLYHSRWDFFFASASLKSDLIVLAVIGIYLEAVRAKAAGFVNVGLWVWFALKTTLSYFSSWGRFDSPRWLAPYLILVALTTAIVDFCLYRSGNETKQMSPRSPSERTEAGSLSG